MQVSDDLLLEGHENVALRITSVSGPNVALGTTTVHHVTIEDDERVQVEFSAATSFAAEAAGAHTVQVRLVAAPGVTLAVPVTAEVIDLGSGTATSGSDYAVFDAQTITFPVGAIGGDTRNVTLAMIDDEVVEDAETVHLLIGPVTGPGATPGAATTHEFAINDDDEAGVPLQIVEIVVNNGDAQRSNIEYLSIRFNQQTNAAALIANGEIVNAVELFRGTNLISLTGFRFQYDTVTWTLTIDLTTDGFGGSRGTLLADGRYQLRFNTALIWAADDVDNILADDDFAPDSVRRYDFHKLLADFNGNAEVDLADRNLFYAHYGTVSGDDGYDFAYDLDRDGDVDYSDYLVWRSQYRKRV